MSAMIEEVKMIAEVYGWKTTVLDTDFVYSEDIDKEEPDMYGLVFTPEGSETVPIVFLSNGKMVSPAVVKLCGLDWEYLYYIAVKTQFAGELVHKVIVHIFKHLQEKGYFSKFEMTDEGQYWETGDEDVLHKQFERYNMLLDSFEFGLKNFPANKKENFDDYIQRMFEMVNKRLIDKENEL